ncbi:MAG: hypothetical protein JWN86_1602 [Planctomycetota bacterium]|nr:hypothetical protein [Planctomycetota bacterium]
MSFIQAGMLGALGALTIPIVIHLMFRRQARTVELGTLQFLKIVLRDNSRKRKLKRYVLLALRLAGVALIAFLFARPYLLANEPIDGSRLVVVLVDRSASMGLVGGKRPIDLASAALRTIVNRAGSGTQLEIALFDREVFPFARASDAIKADLEPTSSGTDYSAAMAWARDLCVRSKASKKELHIFTDLQRSGLDRGDSVKVPSDVEVTLLDLGRSFPKNVGVTALSVSPESLRPRDKGVLSCTVRNASPMPVGKVPVKLHLAAPGIDAIDLGQTVDLAGNSSSILEFRLPEIPEGLWRGNVSASTGDDLGVDDRRHVALSVSPATRILLVDGDPGTSSFESETYFLKAALRLAPAGETYAKAPFAPRTINSDELRSGMPDLSRFAVVVLANVGDLSAGHAKAIADFVTRGGGFLVFSGEGVTAEASANLAHAGLGVGKIIGPEKSGDRPFRIDTRQESHPVFRPFADPEFGDMRRPAFSTITKILPDPSARVLATFGGGNPALLEKTVGRGRVLWFTSSCDRAWSDWPRGRMFLPMVHQMVSHAAGLADGGKIRQEMASGGKDAGISDADGLVTVTNLDPYETETARCTPKEFADRFGFRLPEMKAAPARTSVGRVEADDRVRSDEIWPWLALTLAGVLMLECFLANRTAA